MRLDGCFNDFNVANVEELLPLVIKLLQKCNKKILF